MKHQEISVFGVLILIISGTTAQTNPQHQKTEQRAIQPIENTPNILHTANNIAKQPSKNAQSKTNVYKRQYCWCKNKSVSR